MTWVDIKMRIESMTIPGAQLANALSLIAVAESVPVPDTVTVGGYDKGVSFHWDRRELSVFADRYETYRFLDGKTVIHHWPRSLDDPIDPALLAELADD